MDDADHIAYIYPVQHSWKLAEKAIRNTPGHRPPQIVEPKPKAQYSRRARELTAPPEDAPASSILPCIELKFSRIPRTDRGIVFGSSPNSDVVLPYEGVSGCHFSITFEDTNNLIVKDWGSLMGTEVTYNGQGNGKRRKFQWIVAGHRALSGMNDIVVIVQDVISFQIVVAGYDTRSQECAKKVRLFRQGKATAEDLFGDLELVGETRRPTGTHTPGTGPIYLKKTLGEGSFGVVTRYWNVSTGEEFAVKKPSAQVVRSRSVNKTAWMNEARVMKQVSHVRLHVPVPSVWFDVKLLAFVEDPHPELHLEYLRGGSLELQQNLSAGEALSVLSQCLSALEYLHTKQPPIVHRDIKPANILIQRRFPIHVKLGDFGLSKHSYDVQTFCGTRLYLAPEIYLSARGVKKGYTPVVDVWSLGVVAYELLCDLPPYEDEYTHDGTAWCDKIVQHFQKDCRRKPDELRQFLLSSMVVVAPRTRLTARECHDKVVLLPTSSEGDSQTPTQASYAGKESATTDSYPEDNGTTIQRSRFAANTDSISTIDARRYVESDASAAGPSGRDRKRAATPTSSSSPSSAGGYYKRRLSSTAAILDEFTNYSEDPLNPFFVGSALASLPGGRESDSWPSQSSRDSMRSNQPRNAEGDRGAGAVPQHGSNVPRSHRRSHYTKGGDSAPRGQLDDEELLLAALLQSSSRAG
ncbi:hypothetical protein ACRALDRAFT_1092158 [Sodiomyces alcalophilus JCM 7366]|uniref:uncharacterized protein n=1 Tax=Sodiomyces alcalophilus JCM 7366 TaxID=591952 RepID=UPI0039B64218